MPKKPTDHLDALSELTRKERRLLLAVSAIGIIVKLTGLVPKKIVALGIEFSETDRVLLLRCLAGIIGYFLVSFLIYAIDDLIAVRHSRYKLFFDRIKNDSDLERSKARLFERVKRTKRFRFIMFTHKSMRWIRDPFDFGFPLLVAGAALFLLLQG